MSGPTVRVVRGAPGAEELAALLMALHAMSAPAPAIGPPPPSAAPWPRPTTPLTTPAPAWSTRGRPAWQGA
ncbi:acyl-CoA carboxylase epsilon subunit [Streptomyces sp. NBC_01451]|uniref:acyl-CoA carboxylase epsilon subunit n=1 Tax=Streptomyces sp. NBC_01451 TaxID=2903872 RepID=UPI002E2ED019|nr:acyl-CoA carboxylase epsilon subunit [Streptomyces sp. NBC_01451]